MINIVVLLRMIKAITVKY